MHATFDLRGYGGVGWPLGGVSYTAVTTHFPGLCLVASGSWHRSTVKNDFESWSGYQWMQVLNSVGMSGVVSRCFRTLRTCR